MYSICYIALENNTLHKFKVNKINRCMCMHLIDRESMRLMCLTCWLRSGFSHLMYIDSLRLTWYLVKAESKILKQSKLQEVRQDSETCKCL